MIELFFWGAFLAIVYSYFGYPISLILFGFFKKKQVCKEDVDFDISLIITAYNEEKRIRKKIENTLTCRFPDGKRQIIVASDGSTDKTNDIVKEYEDKGIELYIVKNRGGKENAQKEAVKMARGEIIVFSDVATELEPDGIVEIVSNFSDPNVGCVSSEDRLIGKDGKPCGEGVYVRYEMWLRRLESKVNSLVGLSGSFFAARREVCQDFSGDMQSDFRTLLSSMKLGYRGVSDPAALGYYLDIADSDKEFERKVRTVIRGLTVFFHNLEFLNVFRYGIFSYQYFCHKFLRWLVPVFLILVFVTNIIIAANSTFYYIILICHAAFYSIAVLGKYRKVPFSSSLLKIPMYFLTVNLAILIAWKRYLSGQRVVMWKPTER